MKPVIATLTRTDCKRDNVRVPLPNSLLLGAGRGYCKRGYWISCMHGNAKYIGRAIGRVRCEGKTYVEAALLFGAGHWPGLRWVDPADITECLPYVPAETMAFMLGDWSEPAYIIARIERGFISDLVNWQKGEK